MIASARRGAAATGARVLSCLPPGAARRAPAGSAAALLLMNRALKRCPRDFRAARTAFGFTVSGNTADLIQRYLYLFGVWEPDLSHWLADRLRPGDVVVDIGANIGYFSLLAAGRVGPSGRVIAFEPVPAIADLLQDNADRNGYDVHVVRAVVGDHDGESEMFRADDRNIGRSSTAGGVGTTSQGVLPMTTAVRAIEPDLWPRIRFIKVDVEGDDQRVLRGLEPILRAVPPGAAVFVEVTPDELVARGGSAEELMQSMRGLGFEAWAVPNSYAPSHYARYVRQDPRPLTATPTEQTDVLFVKGEL